MELLHTTTEPGAAVHDNAESAKTPLSTLLQNLLRGEHGPAIVEAIATGRVNPNLVKVLLARAKLPPEQASMVHTFLDSARNTGTDEKRPAAARTGRRGNDVHAMRQELKDLREVNDTVAAALGACPICWGGDGDCGECEGAGAPGSSAPDLKLFEELVTPAIRRVSSQRGARPDNPRRYRR